MFYLRAAEEKELTHDTAPQSAQLKFLRETNYQHLCSESDEI